MTAPAPFPGSIRLIQNRDLTWSASCSVVYGMIGRIFQAQGDTPSAAVAGLLSDPDLKQRGVDYVLDHRGMARR